MVDTQVAHPVGEIIITLQNSEEHISYERAGVTYDSTDKEILDAIQPIILETHGINILEDQDEGAFTIKSVEESHNKFIFPKSTAGY